RFLPAIMAENHYTPALVLVVTSVWMLNLCAAVAVSRRRPLSILDLWLIVTMCAWMFDIALSAMFNAGRFDLGFYAGRIYGLCAASFVLAVLLIDNISLQGQLARLLERLRRQAASERKFFSERERLFTALVE